MKQPQQWPAVRYTSTQLGGGVNGQGVAFPGGLDLITPPLRLQPGALIDCLNFECAPFGGYSRVDGYERFDGHASPSSAVVTVVQLTGLVNMPTVGQIVTQAVSGASGTVVTVVVMAPVACLVLTMVRGAFDNTHAITTSGTSIAGWLISDTGFFLVNDSGLAISAP